MSKKFKESANTTTPEIKETQDLEITNVAPTSVTDGYVSLKSLMETYENVSLRKLSIASELCYGVLLKASKLPIEGVPYDPTAINYDAVENVFKRKGVDYTTIEWETLNAATLRRGSTLSKDMGEFQLGTLVYLRDDNEVPYEILYKTESHIVIKKITSSEPRALSHGTFLMKGPSFTPRTTPNEFTKTENETETEEA